MLGDRRRRPPSLDDRSGVRTVRWARTTWPPGPGASVRSFLKAPVRTSASLPSVNSVTSPQDGRGRSCPARTQGAGILTRGRGAPEEQRRQRSRAWTRCPLSSERGTENSWVLGAGHPGSILTGPPGGGISPGPTSRAIPFRRTGQLCPSSTSSDLVSKCTLDNVPEARLTTSTFQSR